MSLLLDRDLKYYGVDYDYDTEYSCEESGCNSEGICRCGRIYDTRVTGVNISRIADELYNQKFDKSKSTERDNKINYVLFGTGKELDIYCIDRILRSYKIWDNNYWSVDVQGGYYGDEIGSIILDSSLAKKIESDIDEVLSINTLKDKINFILKREYGYLLPELEGCDYELSTIDINDVVFGSDGHYKKIQQENLEHYYANSYEGIRGVLKKDGPKYKIIDGYHRMYAGGLGKLKSNDVKVILVK